MEKFSYTKISTFKSCPIKYFLKYFKKLNLIDYNYSTLLGTIYHQFVEEIVKENLLYRDIYNKYSNKDNLLKALVESKSRSFGEENEKIIEEVLIEELEKHKWMPLYHAFKLLKNNHHLTIINRLQKNNIKIYPEKEYSLKISDEIEIHGIIDLVSEPRKNKIYLFDYKTGKTLNYVDDYQLYFYALLVSENLEKHINEYIIGFVNPRIQKNKIKKIPYQIIDKFKKNVIKNINEIILQFPLEEKSKDRILIKNNDESFEEIKKIVEEYKDEILNIKERFNISANNYCNICEFKEFCPV